MTYVDQIRQSAEHISLTREESHSHLKEWQAKAKEATGTRKERISQATQTPKEQAALLKLYAQQVRLIKDRLVQTAIADSWELYLVVMLGYDPDQSALSTYLYSAIRREDLPDKRRTDPEKVEFDERLHSPQSSAQSQTAAPSYSNPQTTAGGLDVEQVADTLVGQAEDPIATGQLRERLYEITST